MKIFTVLLYNLYSEDFAFSLILVGAGFAPFVTKFFAQRLQINREAYGNSASLSQRPPVFGSYVSHAYMTKFLLF